MARFGLVTGKEWELPEIQAMCGGEMLPVPWKWAVGNAILLDKRLFFMR